ncbi:MAG: PucR family transcriptional regulator [Anaerolineales bacterium]
MSVSELTLTETLRLALEQPPQWLREADATLPAPDWVSLTLEDLHAGDILILTASECVPDRLQEAQRKNAALVISIGKVAEIPSEITLPIAFTEEKIDKRDLQKRLLAVLINARAAVIERGAHIHAQLAQFEAEGRGLEGLVQAMAEMTARGVILQDKRGGILAHHPSTTLAAIWQDILAQFRDLRPLPEAFLDRKRVGSHPTIHCQELGGGLSCLIAPVVVGEVARGYLSLIGVQGEFDSLDYLVVEQGGLVLAIEMARNKAIRETEKRLKGDLLNALLQEILTPRDARLWLQTMGLNPHQAHVALRFMWDSPAAPSRRRLETIINGEIAQRGLRAIVHPMGSEVICFCPLSDETARPQEAIALAEAILQQAQREYPQAIVRCGIGTPAVEVGEWRVSFSRAGQALDMARRLNERSPLYYPDLSVYRLLLQLEHSPELIAFQEEILGNLLATENPQEFLNTLEAFFAHNGNLSQTAESLYIHRNTLVYRLERIAAITQIDLDKPENRLAIQLALHIYRMTRPLEER